MAYKSSNGKYILGVFCCFHDASACLLHNGRLIAMAEEERFARIKHTSNFPENAIRYCLKKANIKIDEVSCITYGFIPWRYFIAQSLMAIKKFPRSLNLLRKGASYMPLHEKLIGMINLRRSFCNLFEGQIPDVIYIDHHTAHAYSAFYVSPFDEAAILITDGFGEDNATSFYYGQDEEIEYLGSIPYPDSLGVYYGAITQYLGFRPHHDEYKVMGMGAYGEDKYRDFFGKMLTIDNQMIYKIDLSYIDLITHGVRQWFSPKMERELGSRREYNDRYEKRHFDIAHSAQRQLEDIAIKLAKKLKEKTGSKKLCVAGGVSQNVLMNRKLLDECGFDDIYIPPVAYDGGISLGCALAAYHLYFNGKRRFILDSPSWGPDYSLKECGQNIKEKGLSLEFHEDVTHIVARLLAEGKIVGYFDGRMEIGPRALGNRSIFADPRRKDIKDILNARIKKREFFRPFAPMVTLEDCQAYFDLPVESPFMTLCGRVKTPSALPAITHKDGTARVQTVKKQTFPNIHLLLRQFEKIAGVPVLLNTSLNENEPIVCSPQEAIDCFLRTHMDAIAFNNQLLVTR